MTSTTVQVIIRGDGSGAQAAFEDTTRSARDTEQQVQRTGRSFDDLSGRATRMAQTATQAGKALSLALTVPITGLAATAVAAFSKQEAAEQRLRAALQANGRQVDALMGRYQRFASQMQALTVVGDETTLAMLQQAESFGLTGAAAERAVRNAIAMEAAFGTSATSALRYTAALEEGNATMLTRYLPSLRDIKDESERVAEAQRLLGNAFGVAEAQAQTTAGQIAQMKNALGDAAEVIGGIIAEHVIPLATRIKEAAEAFQSLDENTQRNVVAVAALAAALGPALIAAGLVTNAVIALSGALTVLAGKLTAVIAIKAGIAAAVIGIAVAIERHFTPGMEQVSLGAQAFNIVTRAAVILRETLLGVGELMLALGVTVVGGFQAIVAPLTGIVEGLAQGVQAAFDRDIAGVRAALLGIPGEIAGAYQAAQQRIDRGIGFAADSVQRRVRNAVEEVTRLQSELLQTAKAAEDNGRRVGGLAAPYRSAVQQVLAMARASRQVTTDMAAAAAQAQRLREEGLRFLESVSDLEAQLAGPLAVAMRRHNQLLAEAAELKRTGAITAEEYARAEAVFVQQLSQSAQEALGWITRLQDQMMRGFTIAGLGGAAGGGAGGRSLGDELARSLSFAISSSQGRSLGDSIGNALRTTGMAGIQEGLQDAMGEALSGLDLDDAQMSVAFLAIGEAIAGNMGAAIGSVLGAAIGSFFPGGTMVGAAIGNALGSLFDRQKDPKFQVGGTGGGFASTGAGRTDLTVDTALGQTMFRFRNIDREAQLQLRDALQTFDATLAGVIRDEGQLQQISEAIARFGFDSADQGASLQDTLEARFNAIIHTFDDFTRWMVQGADSLEDQFQRLADIMQIRTRMAIGDTLGTDEQTEIWLSQELNRVGETMAEAFQRFLTVTASLDTALGLTGNTMAGSRVELIRFGDALVAAFGDDLQRLTSGLNRIFGAFFSDEERLDQAISAARQRATDLLTSIGLTVTEEMLSQTGFREVFDELFGALGPEQTAQLLEAGVAIADLIDAEGQLADIRGTATDQVQDTVEAERRLLELREAMAEIDREILRFQAPTIAAYRDLIDAQQRQLTALMDLDASETQLARARELHHFQLRQFTADLEMSILSLADGLFGAERQATQTTQAVATAATGMRDQIIRALQGITDWLDRSLLGNLSPLTPQQRLAEAEEQFRKTFASAISGDADALSALPQAADAWLGEAGSFFGTSTSEFGAIFDRVREMMGQASAIRPPADQQAPTFGQVASIESNTSQFRQALDEMQRVQSAWRIAEQLSALAQISANGSAFEIAERLGFTSTNMREILELLGADVGEELEPAFNDLLAGISGQDPMLGSIDLHVAESSQSLREIRTELAAMRGDLAGLLVEGNADRRAQTRTTAEGLAAVVDEERAVRAAIGRDRPAVARGIRP